MTREDILDRYRPDRRRVTSPGKFEHEPIYVPFFWDATMDGGGDDHGSLQGITIDGSDFDTWPELRADGWGIGDTMWMFENELGLVSLVCDLTAWGIINGETAEGAYSNLPHRD